MTSWAFCPASSQASRRRCRRASWLSRVAPRLAFWFGAFGDGLVDKVLAAETCESKSFLGRPSFFSSGTYTRRQDTNKANSVPRVSPSNSRSRVHLSPTVLARRLRQTVKPEYSCTLPATTWSLFAENFKPLSPKPLQPKPLAQISRQERLKFLTGLGPLAAAVQARGTDNGLHVSYKSTYPAAAPKSLQPILAPWLYRPVEGLPAVAQVRASSQAVP